METKSPAENAEDLGGGKGRGGVGKAGRHGGSWEPGWAGFHRASFPAWLVLNLGDRALPHTPDGNSDNHCWFHRGAFDCDPFEWLLSHISEASN